MKNEFIKLDYATPEKPEIKLIAEDMNITKDAAIGALVRLWIWLSRYDLADTSANISPKTIDSVVNLDGFSDALIRVNWMNYNPINNLMTFPGFIEHSPKKLTKHIAQNAERQRRFREKARLKTPSGT